MYWQDPKNRRSFYERFAKRQGFDPLVAANWYPVTRSVVFARNEVHSTPSSLLPSFLSMSYEQNSDLILKIHNGKFIRSLVELFPDVAFDEAKFAIAASMEIERERQREVDRARDREIEGYTGCFASDGDQSRERIGTHKW